MIFSDLKDGNINASTSGRQNVEWFVERSRSAAEKTKNSV